MYSSRKLAVIIFSLFILNQIGYSQGSYSLTLEECLLYAMEHNQNVLNTQLEYEKQEKFVGETLSQGLPQIDGFIDFRNNFNVPTSFIPAEFFGGQQGEFEPVKFGTQYIGNISASVKQMLFYGSYFVGVQAAKTFVDLSSKDHIRNQIDVAEAVTKGFYAILINELGLDLVDKNYNRLDSLLRETKIMYQNGFAEKIDVSRIQVQFNNIKTTKKNSGDLLDLSYQQLKFQMGMPIDQELELIGELSDLGQKINLDDTGDFSYSDRIEYSIMNTRDALAQYELKNENVQYLPKIDFYLTAGANTGAGTRANLFNNDQWFEYGYYGLQMSIPIFDGLYKSYKIQQVKIKMHQIKNTFDLLENSIDLEIQTAKITLDNALINLETQEENMGLSQEVYNITKIKYQEGIGSNIELIEADATYKEAQNNYYQALYQVLISKVDLDKALGVLYNQNTVEFNN